MVFQTCPSSFCVLEFHCDHVASVLAVKAKSLVPARVECIFDFRLLGLLAEVDDDIWVKTFIVTPCGVNEVFGFLLPCRATPPRLPSPWLSRK
jgi:hypothetical protein